jgi:hypothetical protein
MISGNLDVCIVIYKRIFCSSASTNTCCISTSFLQSIRPHPQQFSSQKKQYQFSCCIWTMLWGSLLQFVIASNCVYIISFFLKAEVYFCAVFLEVVTASLFTLLSSADSILFIWGLLLKLPKRWDTWFVFPYTCAFWKWMFCFREQLLESCTST